LILDAKKILSLYETFREDTISLYGLALFVFLLLMENNQTTVMVLDKTELALSSWTKTLLLAIYIVASFAVPFLLGQPQILVGTLVNAFLVL